MAQYTRDSLSAEALFILENLKENSRLGRSNKLADVKTTLEPSVSLEFDTYFFFLRKFHYIAMDREAQLKLTDTGDRVVSGEAREKFTGDVGEFFADRFMGEEEATRTGDNADLLPPPPPPPDDDLLSEPSQHTVMTAPPTAPPIPPARGIKKGPPPFRQKAAPLPPPVDEPLMEQPPPPNPPAAEEEPLPPLATGKQDVMEVRRPAPPLPSVPVPPAPSPSLPPAPKSTLTTSDSERYQKGDPLGAGPLGTVFKGRHGALGTDVAIKELKDIFGYFSFLQRSEVTKRLKKELCAQASVRHPAVVQVLDQNTDVARAYVVVELLAGSLREKIDAGGGKGMPMDAAVRTFLQLAYGLQAAHATGLTHHNLKPENVLFDASGNAKLGDFGLGRVIEVDQSKGLPQVFVGTGGMAYMAPELLSRSKEAGASADVYALGILLYEMLTGQLPGRRSPLPSEVNAEAPKELDAIFDKMTQDRREARFQDVDAVLSDFYAAFTDGKYGQKGDLILWSKSS